MRILYIAYPLLTVSPESAGGAEQVLWTLEREMAARGVTTSVAASLGSQVSGELVATGEPCSLPDDFERRSREHHDRVIQLIGERTGSGVPFDLIHDMSASFWPRAREVELPVLATLHLPRHFYSSQLFENIPADVSFNCVSRSQAQCFADLPRLEGVVANGIALESFTVNAGGTPRQGALWLGRICEEKAPHLAIEIAEEAGWSLTLAGQVYPFSYHRAYFERAIAPRLRAPDVTFIGSPSIAAKRALLRDAEAILITSQVDETSSLVAMEAAASGTPVIAFRRGALSEVVQEGVTGFLVDGVEQAAQALRHVAEIEANACARHAALHYSSAAMARGYWQLYQRIIHGWTSYGTDLQDDKSSISAV